MATYLLDTNIIIDAISDKRNRNAALIALAESGNTLACCPINIAEIYISVRPKEEQRTAALLQSLRLYAFAVAELPGRLKRCYAGKGIPLATFIAAVAIHYDLGLITDSTGDFPMPEISLYSLPG